MHTQAAPTFSETSPPPLTHAQYICEKKIAISRNEWKHTGIKNLKLGKKEIWSWPLKCKWYDYFKLVLWQLWWRNCLIRVYPRCQPLKMYRYLPRHFFAHLQNVQKISFFASKKLLQNSSQVYSGTFQISNTEFPGSLKNIMLLFWIDLFWNKCYPQSAGQT